MKLKGFLKDRIGYIIVYFAGVAICILIMCLTLIINKSEFSKENVLYAILISTIFFLIFMVYEYYRMKPFYKNLITMLESNEELNYILNSEDAKTSEQRIYKELLSKIYKIHSEKLFKYEESHREYIYFINQWVHQMKTPVSVINLILLDQKSEEYREIFGSIAEENEKIAHGLEMMLNHARLNEFNLDFKIEDVDIVSIVRKVVNDNKKSLIRNFIFPRIIAKDSVNVKTDKKWIYFVINQIFTNAIKYSKDIERENKYITFRISDEELKTVLSIKDEGIGIPKEDLGRVFQAFFTGKNGRKVSESTGMGMYLSKRICDNLGHELLLESEEGSGTTFSIVFYKGKSIFKF